MRLGVKRLLLIDPETLSISNAIRVYGSTSSDVNCKIPRLRGNVACAPARGTPSLRAGFVP